MGAAVGTKPKFTEAQNTQICKLVAEGKTARQIAKELGVSFNCIRGKLNSMKLSAAPDIFWNEVRVAKLDAMSKEGRTVNEIAASVNATLRAVAMKLKSMRRPCIKMERQKPDKMPQVRFEDMPAEVLAREPKGRMPLRSHARYSLTGNAARMCLS